QGRRRDHERRAREAPGLRVPGRDERPGRWFEELMARRDSAPRRYADAAFEIARRDGTVETWRKELEAAAETSTAGELERGLAPPALPLEDRVSVAEQVSPKLSGPVGTLILLLVRRGRIEQLPRVAAEFRRL